MVRLSVLASLLLSLAIPGNATSAPLAKEAEVNGVRIQYLEDGSGEPVVFVHGVVSDHRAWEPVRDEIARKYRFIALTQRYFGTGPWKDDGREYSVATFTDDLAKFVTSLNAGPVHLVGWSFGGHVAATMAVKNPSLVRSLVLYEASMISVLPADSAEGKAAREDRARIYAPAAAASKAGDPVKATRLLVEAVFQLPPGGSDREPQAFQTMWDDNARTVRCFHSTATTEHHMRHADEFHPTDTGHAGRENADIVRDDKRRDQQVCAGCIADRSPNGQP